MCESKHGVLGRIALEVSVEPAFVAGVVRAFRLQRPCQEAGQWRTVVNGDLVPLPIYPARGKRIQYSRMSMSFSSCAH